MANNFLPVDNFKFNYLLQFATVLQTILLVMAFSSNVDIFLPANK